MRFFMRDAAARGRRRHARQDDDERHARVGAARDRRRPELPGRRRVAATSRRTSASGPGRGSSSRATSTTPRSSTRAPSSCTTSPMRSCSTRRVRPRRHLPRPRPREGRVPDVARAPAPDAVVAASADFPRSARRRRGERPRARSTSAPARARLARRRRRATTARARVSRSSVRTVAGVPRCCRSRARINVANALGVVALTHAMGVPLDGVVAALAAFRGVKRRPGGHRRGPRRSRVVDDFAHHPTAVAGTIAALRARYPRPAPLGALRAALQHDVDDASSRTRSPPHSRRPIASRSARSIVASSCRSPNACRSRR